MQQIALFILGGSEEDADHETKSRGTRSSDSEEEGDVVVRAPMSDSGAETENLFPDKPLSPGVKTILRELSTLNKFIQDHANSFYHKMPANIGKFWLSQPRSRVAGIRYYVASRIFEYVEAGGDCDDGKTRALFSILCY